MSTLGHTVNAINENNRSYSPGFEERFENISRSYYERQTISSGSRCKNKQLEDLLYKNIDTLTMHDFAVLKSGSSKDFKTPSPTTSAPSFLDWFIKSETPATKPDSPRREPTLYEKYGHDIAKGVVVTTVSSGIGAGALAGKSMIEKHYDQKIKQMDIDETKRREAKLEEKIRIEEEQIKIAEENNKADLEKFMRHVQDIKNGIFNRPDYFEENEEIFWKMVDDLQGETNQDERAKKFGAVYMVYRRMQQGRRPS